LVCGFISTFETILAKIIMYASLEKLIEKLKTSPRVKGIFSTGTTATRMNPSSDIDLIVVLDKNTENIKSVYTSLLKGQAL